MKSELVTLPSPVSTVVTVHYQPLSVFIDLWSDAFLFDESFLGTAMGMWRDSVMHPIGPPIFSRQDKRGVFDKMTLHANFCDEEGYEAFLLWVLARIKDEGSYKSIEVAQEEHEKEMNDQDAARMQMLKDATEGGLGDEVATEPKKK